MRMRCVRGLWLAAMLCVSSLGAAGNDAPLADAVQRRDKQAVLSLLKEQRRCQRAPERRRDGAALGGVPGGRGHDGAADPRRSQGRYAQQLRRDPAGARRRKRQRRGHRAVVEGRRRSERRRACRRDAADARGAHRTSADAVKALLSAGAKVDAKETWNGQTALMWAAAAGHGPVVQVLIDHGADIHARSNAGTTPLLFAVRQGDMAFGPRAAGGGRGREGDETRRRDAVARGGDQRARGSRGSAARQGGRSECRGRIDRADGAGRARPADGAQIPDAHATASAIPRAWNGATILGASRCTPPCTSPTGTSAISSSRCRSTGCASSSRCWRTARTSTADEHRRSRGGPARRYRRQLAGATAFLLAAKVG